MLDHGNLKVVDASPGTPAAEAGIRIGDFVTSIGGIDVARQSLRDTKLMLKQLPVGKPLPVKIRRDGVERLVTVIPRDLVPD